MPQQQRHYIGLMSGTSLDGIDGVRVQFNGDIVKVLRHENIAYPETLRNAFAELLTPGENEIERLIKARHLRTQLACELVDRLCAGLKSTSVTAIADHGQTIRHYPDAEPPYSLQLHDGPGLSECAGIDCVVDFRSQDIAAGGQGAPLVPAFHQAFFAHPSMYRAVVNIGGIANISLIAPDKGPSPSGFDVGPGNTLLDTWCQKHTGQAYDTDGQWGASGQVNRALLTSLLGDPYFSLPSPKSSGREYFNLSWLQRTLLDEKFSRLPPENIQASLVALTVHSICLGIQQACTDSGLDPENDLEGIYLCGGGVYNQHLFSQIAETGPAPVYSSDRLGVPPQQVEATAFAWLGKQALDKRAVELYRTTGARHNNVLGAVYRSSS